jgi:cellulose synthase (UDP-forming)
MHRKHGSMAPSSRIESRPLGPRSCGLAVEQGTDYAVEIRITLATIALTIVAWLAVSWETTDILWRRFHEGEIGGSLEQLTFIAIIQALIWGNFIYQFARLGYLRRRLAHSPLSVEKREGLYDQSAPTLAILVPSYKEELPVVRRTLLSAALQDYPSRRVVLLVDDPPRPCDRTDRAALKAMRQLPTQLQRMFDSAAVPFEQARAAFLARARAGGLRVESEALTLADLYEQAARWLEVTGQRYPVTDHADRLFRDAVLGRAARAHRERAQRLRSLANLSPARAEREYLRLATLFRVEITSFERKRYINLSHQTNKAMNLNSYIGLLGRSWQEVSRSDGLYLEPASAGCRSIEVPDADFLITLDADSLLVPEYALVLVNEMLRPGNERLAVAQTPYNTIPNPPGLLERIAGATTDIQYLIHQGFTCFDATYWVGANALLRVAALRDISELVRERGFEVPVFIQDRTVIEDTESSVDLVACGWKLYNYPERLAFSATPPDFGSLLIQRRRWANGGLIILPKLVRYLAARAHRAPTLVESFFRIHYLGSITAVNVGLVILLGHGFETSVQSFWLPLTALPYFLLYARDLRYSGYPSSDLVRVYALNLLLIPVNLGGVFRSLQQALTGRRIPFGRTPKVSGRTAAPARYVLAAYGLLAAWLVGFGIDVAAARWFSALFWLLNALMLAYAILSFVGLRESWEDVRLCLSVRWRSAMPTGPDAAPMTSVLPSLAGLLPEVPILVAAARFDSRSASDSTWCG